MSSQCDGPRVIQSRAEEKNALGAPMHQVPEPGSLLTLLIGIGSVRIDATAKAKGSQER